MRISLNVFMAAAEEIGVAEEAVVETTRPAWLLKKDLETACKNMLLLAVDSGLKEAMPLIGSGLRATEFEHCHPSFHRRRSS